MAICGKCKARDVSVDHVKACYSTCNTVEVVVSVPADIRPVTEDGMYRTSDTVIYKVQWNQSKTNLYAKVLVHSEDPEGEADAHFEYAPGALRHLTAADKMTLEQAKNYGALYGTCIVCGRTLTDERSIEAGIGPVCAGKGFWA